MIQEAVNNTLKHANATTVSVRIDSSGEKLSISVHDDGKGFDVTQPEQASELISAVSSLQAEKQSTEIRLPILSLTGSHPAVNSATVAARSRRDSG